MLSFWMRLKYPFVIDAALAASAPVKLVSGITMSPGFFEAVTNDFNAANPMCPQLVRQGFSKYLEIVAMGEPGYKTLTETFKTCDPITRERINDLFMWIINSFGNLAMVDYPYPANFLAPLPAWPIKYACDLILKAPTPLEGIVEVVSLFYNGTNGNLPCFNISAEYVSCSDQTGCGTGPDGISWDYQACSEVIYFPNTNNVTDMFPPRDWTIQNLTEHCLTNWGIIPRPDWLREYFGGVNIEFSSRIIFSNGLLDPWHGGGILTSLSESLVAVIIKEGAHHLDLRESNPADPPSVIEARNIEKSYLTKWLAEIKMEKQIN